MTTIAYHVFFGKPQQKSRFLWSVCDEPAFWYDESMGVPYRPRIQKATLQKLAQAMVSRNGKQLSNRALQDFFRKDKDLKHMVYGPDSFSKTQAHKTLRAFAQKIGSTDEKMSFSMWAKKMGFSGKGIPESGLQHVYEHGVSEEVGQEVTGPTKQELHRQQVREDRKKARNLFYRQMEEEKAKKEALMHAPRPQTVVSANDLGKARSTPQAPGVGTTAPHVVLPPLAGGVSRPGFDAPKEADDDEQPLFPQKSTQDTKTDTKTDVGVDDDLPL